MDRGWGCAPVAYSWAASGWGHGASWALCGTWRTGAGADSTAAPFLPYLTCQPSQVVWMEFFLKVAHKVMSLLALQSFSPGTGQSRILYQKFSSQRMSYTTKSRRIIKSFLKNKISPNLTTANWQKGSFAEVSLFSLMLSVSVLQAVMPQRRDRELKPYA